MRVCDDGLTHLNVYSKAKTHLGRALSNFSYSPITLGEEGEWNSVEAYWGYLRIRQVINALKAGARPEKDWSSEIAGAEIGIEGLRYLHGFKAKNAFKKILDLLPTAGPKEPTEEFKAAIKAATRTKVFGSSWIRRELCNSGELPLVHYYWFGNDPETAKIVEKKEYRWLMDYLEELRTELQN